MPSSQKVPRYLELLTHLRKRMVFDQKGLDAFRCRVELPVLHSLVKVNFPDAVLE